MTLRLAKFLNRGVDSIQAQFSDELDTRISTANVSIISNLKNIDDLVIRAVEIDADVITVTTSPQWPLALYTVSFLSTDAQAFASINGDTLQEAGQNSSVQFVGMERQNQLRTEMLDSLSPVYNVEADTLVRKHISNVSNQLAMAKADTREVGNANYIEVEIVDEVKTRGTGPTDRLNNEGVFKVVRVSLLPTGTSALRSIDFESSRATDLLQNDSDRASTLITGFPADPVSLRMTTIVDERVSNREDDSNGFDGLLITVTNKNVIQLHSVTLETEVGDLVVYDLQEHGYAMASNRYDTVHGKVLVTLESNQIKLSDSSILFGSFQMPSTNDTLIVSYAFADPGVNVDPDTVEITQVKTKTREAIGGFQTIFYLSGFPVVDAAGSALTLDGVEFLDPSPSSGLPFTAVHPAFSDEIVFDETRLPGSAGEYAINYLTGQVFVYGRSIADGTGSAPPVATYLYLKSFVPDIDYSLDPDTDEAVANSSRDLIGQEVTLSFRYEEVLADGTDFRTESHTEVLDEEVENRLVGAFRIMTENSPITNVFRISNQTTGELYQPTSFSENVITFSGRSAPKVTSVTNESAAFVQVFNDDLNETEVLQDNGTAKKIKCSLSNNSLIGHTSNSVGSNVNTSTSFSIPELFERQFFYDHILQSVSQNLAKITQAGDFLIDHQNGIVYLYCESSVADFGQISYQHAHIDPIGKNILSADSLNYRVNTNSDILLQIQVSVATATTIEPEELPALPERFLLGNTDKPIILGAKQYGVAGQRTVGSVIFVALDAVFTTAHADGNHFIRFTDDEDRAVVAFIDSTSVELDIPFTDNDKSIDWVLVDFDFADGYTAITGYEIQNVRAVYEISALQNNPLASLVNFYDASVDEVSGNLITFNNDLIKTLEPGAALAIDYDFGNVYVDYTHVEDDLQVSYEWGDNSLNFSISDAVSSEQQYYASYSYGALRDSLNSNFGALTQLPELSNFLPDTNRELYRNAVAGALQAFVKGPTAEAIKIAVSSITGIEPNVTELTFNEWTAGRDNLHFEPADLVGEESYGDRKSVV